MRVLHVIPFLDPVQGGPPIFVLDLVATLTEMGIQSTIVTTQRPGERRMMSTDFRVITFSCDLPWYRYSSRLWMWLLENAASFDLFHVHYLFTFPSFAAARIGRLGKVPYVLHPHGVLNVWGLRHRRPLLKRAWLRLFERPILRDAATVLYASDEEKAEATLTHLSENSQILPYAVRPPRADRIQLARAFHQRRPSRQSLLVLYLSRLDPKKGQEVLIPAWGAIISRFPGALLLIAGSGSPAYEHSLRQLASRHGIEHHIAFLGFLSGEERWAALAAADVFVLPSYSESFGIAVIEAMCVGTPVVLSNAVALSRAVREACAGLVTPCSVEGVAESLTTMLADSELRYRAGEKARQLADRFCSLEAVAQRLKIIYEEITRRSNSPRGD